MSQAGKPSHKLHLLQASFTCMHKSGSRRRVDQSYLVMQKPREAWAPLVRSFLFLVRHAEILSVVVGQIIDIPMDMRIQDPITDPTGVRPDPGGSIA